MTPPSESELSEWHARLRGTDKTIVSRGELRDGMIGTFGFGMAAGGLLAFLLGVRAENKRVVVRKK